MFATERKRIIKRYLLENEKASVGKLSELLEVSEVTIRRDLEMLEKENFLQRTHGGAILTESEPLLFPVPYEVGEDIFAQQREIADTAYHFVSDGQFIMITDGSTNLQIAKKLALRSNLTVLTNDLLIALEFSNSPANKLILLGGDLDNHAVFGQLSINNLNDFSLNHIFFEVDGITLNNGLSVSSISRASLIQHASRISNIATAVCLPDNFGSDSFYRIGPISFPKKVLTSHSLADRFKHELFENNIQLYTSVDLYEE